VQLQFLNTDANPLAGGSEYEADQSLASIAKKIGEITGAIAERQSAGSTTGKTLLLKTSLSKNEQDSRYFISHNTSFTFLCSSSLMTLPIAAIVYGFLIYLPAPES
jgi:hypothetical protein